MKILVLGSGAREHALVTSLIKSPSVHKVFVSPGNDAMSEIATKINFISNHDLIEFCKANNIDLVIISSPKYFDKETAMYLLNSSIPLIGPVGGAEKIEESKAFIVKFLEQNKIPTPKTLIANSYDEAIKYIKNNKWISVVKSNVISKGEGVLFANSEIEAIHALDKIAAKFGFPVLLQEKLEGIEFAYSILTDGSQWISFSSTREYKKRDDGDIGPATGGLGSISPMPTLNKELEEYIKKQIVQPLVNGLYINEISFRGFLSLSLILTSEGPKVIKVNARLGDPESQSILTRFRGDIASLLLDCARSKLDSSGSEVAFGSNYSVSVVIARDNYPYESDKEPFINGFDEVKDVYLYFSSCFQDKNTGYYKFNNGRLITITSIDGVLTEASKKCYKAISSLSLANVHFRKDIGIENK